MFGVDFSELIVILVVTLIVVGPERLPKVRATLGHLWGRLQRYVSSVKADISREVAAEEFRQMQRQLNQEAATIEREVSLAAREAAAEAQPPEGRAQAVDGGAGSTRPGPVQEQDKP
jgi:sec-independent protein translocase protein TatB